MVVVVGPTASGKTALSIALAQHLGGEIVNTDSVALYRGLDIGSAKPSLAERVAVPHHLIDVLDPSEEANVAIFQQRARDAIDDILGRDRVPILVGGSSLYIRAVIDDLEFPGTDPEVRARWQMRLDAEGPAALHAVLTERDPHAAAEILPTNGRRIVRALEVIELTGQPFAATMPGYESRYRKLVMVGLSVERAALDARLDSRVEAMFEAGLVAEVESISVWGPTAERALGYQQVLAYLAGELTEAQAHEATKRVHRKFARRQERMFRQDPRVHWLPYDAADLVKQAIVLVEPPSPAR